MMFLEILGNLGSDAETRYTANGKMLAQLRVAVNSRRKDRDGEYQERTDWFSVRVGGPKAEYAGRFTKGNRVLVRGRLEIGQYTSRETGEVRTSYDIWAEECVNLSPRDETNRGQGESGSSTPRERATQPIGAGSAERARAEDAADLDEVPF